MRTKLFRTVVALVALFTASAAPALAQSIVRGTVKDAQGRPVADAQIAFDSQASSNRIETKTDRNGNFMQIGLPSGTYKATASKEGIGEQTVASFNVTQGQNMPLEFTLGAPPTAAQADSMTPEERAKATALALAATSAMDAMRAERYDDAIAGFNEVLLTRPNCGDCYYNIGLAHSKKQEYEAAEVAFKKVTELDPNSSEAYTGLTGVYNAQKKFDLAAAASAKAAELSGAGGGSEAAYNQGVILFNSGKFEEARAQFEAAAVADPNNGLAQYQLGMTSLNLGQIPQAVAALEMYLKVDPDGEKAAEVKAALPALQTMLKN
jgi:tetratricopeptide (TPR) repeat protein